jgi:hypothetical protein
MIFVNVNLDGKLEEQLEFDPSDPVVGATEFFSKGFNDNDGIDHLGRGLCL